MKNLIVSVFHSKLSISAYLSLIVCITYVEKYILSKQMIKCWCQRIWTDPDEQCLAIASVWNDALFW
jgi:hypothetical protein